MTVHTVSTVLHAQPLPKKRFITTSPPSKEGEKMICELKVSKRKRRKQRIASLQKKVKALEVDNEKDRRLLQSMQKRVFLLAKCNHLLRQAQINFED
jgi:hypothetical protein